MTKLNALVRNYWQKIISFRLNKGGFTLIEILIVLVVVSLLMAIILPNIAGQQDRINDNARINMAETINNHVSSYALVTGDRDGVSLDELVLEDFITQRQADEARSLLGDSVTGTITGPIVISDAQP